MLKVKPGDIIKSRYCLDINQGSNRDIINPIGIILEEVGDKGRLPHYKILWFLPTTFKQVTVVDEFSFMKLNE